MLINLFLNNKEEYETLKQQIKEGIANDNLSTYVYTGTNEDEENDEECNLFNDICESEVTFDLNDYDYKQEGFLIAEKLESGKYLISLDIEPSTWEGDLEDIIDNADTIEFEANKIFK